MSIELIAMAICLILILILVIILRIVRARRIKASTVADTVCTCGPEDGCDICGNIPIEKERTKVKSKEEIVAEREKRCKEAGCVVCMHCNKPIVMHQDRVARKVKLGYVAQGCLNEYLLARQKEEQEKKAQDENVK